MKDCKDCMFCKMCYKRRLGEHLLNPIEENIAPYCPDFKNGSEITGLPCKPWDMVFIIEYLPDENGRFRLCIKKRSVSHIEVSAAGTRIICYETDTTYDIRLFGERIFLSEEKAKKALEKKRNEKRTKNDLECVL